MLGQQTTEEDAVAESLKRSASSSQPGAASAPVWGVDGGRGGGEGSSDACAAAEPSGTQRPVAVAT